ncbi:MAG TPA: DUF2971 domain-containing protein [Vicinamibacterales bacterium]|nr:DUF2971 domain-containing protein [Vicinamibacterales bacterium]
MKKTTSPTGAPLHTRAEGSGVKATESLPLWRYLDLARLIAILAKKQLPLIRLDLFPDPFEGSVLPSYDEASKHQQVREYLTELRRTYRRQTYVSCWTASDHESEAMWRLYCGPRDGVAMRTTFSKLKVSLPDSVRLAIVEYIDHADSPSTYTPDMLWYIMRKRPSFEHEQEVRAVYLDQTDLLLHTARIRHDKIRADPSAAIGFDWEPEIVIEQVYVSPHAEEWYQDVVQSVLERFAPALVERLCWSGMREMPHF